MTIEEQGFLSPEIAPWIDKHRSENRAWFSLAMNLNSVAQQLWLAVPSTIAQWLAVPSEEAIWAACLFIRGLSSFQSTVLLAERGMTQDARTTARSCFETVFCLGALLKNRDFLGKFEKANLHNKKTFANASLEGGVKLDPGVSEKLIQFLDDFKRSGENAKPLIWKEVANSAGLGNVYDVYYRGLSNDAAHPSLIALKRYCDVDENNEFKGFHWGPDVKDVEATLMASRTACWYLVVWTAERVEHPEIKEKLDRCSEEYKRLIEVAKAADLA
jgi:hypothetical protein